MQVKLFLATALAVISSCALADSPEAAQATDFNPVVVTATRFEQPAADALVPILVLTREDIERLQPRSLVDLLDGHAGIGVGNNGGLGQLTSVFLRGTGSAHTLVLVDGIRMGSASSGMPAWEQLPIEQIERIEIVRGPRSAWYGADAVGGVVQIFTRRGHAGGGWQPSFAASVGTQGSWSSQAGIAGGGENRWFNASIGTQYTRGIDSCRSGAGTVFAACFAEEPDRDGFRARSVLLGGGQRWANGAELRGNFLRTTGFVEYDGSWSNYSRHAQQIAGVHLALPLTSAWQTSVAVGRSEDKTTDYADPHLRGVPRTYVAYLDSRRDQASWLNRVLLGAGQELAFGADWQEEKLDTDTLFTRTSRDNSGVFAHWQGRFGGHELQLSARHDDNQQFGGHATGALAWGYHFASGLVASASWASAFHAPTFNDLYYPSFPGFPPSANPELAPEKARQAELDLSQRHRSWYWQASLWRQQIDDLIALDANFTPGNISRARIAGFDGEAGGSIGDWTWLASLTWQRPENRDGGTNAGNRLPRRFGRSARTDLDRGFGAFSVGATLRAFGPRYDDAANLHRLGGYGLLDLRAGWFMSPHWQWQLALGNVLDHRYETVWYYNQPGRTATLTLRFQP